MGVLHIFGSRSDYQEYRGTATLIDYLRLANTSIEMAAYWIAYGVESQGLADEICNLLSERPSLSVTLAVIHPDSSHLDALAKHLNRSSRELRDRIANSLVKLTEARAALPGPAQARYHVKVYDSLPVASIIMLDRTEPNGRIQIEIKPYHTAQHKSFAIEVTRAESSLYKTLTDAGHNLVADAIESEGVYTPSPSGNRI